MPTFYTISTETRNPQNTQLVTMKTIWMGVNEKKARRVYEQYITGVKRTDDWAKLDMLRLTKTVVDDVAHDEILENKFFMDTEWWYTAYQAQK